MCHVPCIWLGAQDLERDRRGDIDLHGAQKQVTDWLIRCTNS